MRTFLALCLLLAAVQDAPKAKPPAGAGLEATKKAIREGFKADYASRSAEVLKRLAERLRDEGLRAKDPSEGFAFLEEAQKRCREMGGYLVCVDTEEEQAFVEKLAGQNKVWLGGLRVEGAKWSWMNGRPMTFMRWAPGQPNNGNNCFAQYWPGAGWHDIGQNERYPAGFICEWEF